MEETCEWCESGKTCATGETVYWELPDGTGAITITGTPSISCNHCGIVYQSPEIVKYIEEQLFLVDRKKLAKKITYSELMALPRVLKRNYFDFS